MPAHEKKLCTEFFPTSEIEYFTNMSKIFLQLLMAGRAQPSDELFLQVITSVVGSDADTLARSRQSCQRLIADVFTDGAPMSPAWYG